MGWKVNADIKIGTQIFYYKWKDVQAERWLPPNISTENAADRRIGDHKARGWHIIP
jgi:hypothetical protein